MPKKYRFLQKLWLSMLCLVLLLGILIPSGSAQAARTADFDYGNPKLSNNITIFGSDLLSRLYGITPSHNEAAYLNTQSDLLFHYSNTIPQSIVSTVHNGEAGTLDVSLGAYSFTANNGSTVTWIPVRATIKDTMIDFVKSGETYSCRFDGMYYSENYTMNLEFSWTVEIPEEDARQLLNAAYHDGSLALDEILTYEAKLAKFQTDLTAYNTHQHYLQWCKDYADFEAAMVTYNAEKQLYDDYIWEYNNVYKVELERYQAWRAYYNYLKYEAALDEGKYQAYMAYKAEVDEVIADLAVLESLFTADSNGWVFYNSLMGDSVTQVIAQRELLLLGGCELKHIENAAASTDVLRDLMEQYATLRKAKYTSDHEKLTTLFKFYSENYITLRDNFQLLYDSIMPIYQTTGVPDEMNKLGKLLRFQQFAGQLYVTSTALNDQKSRTDQWNISKKKLEAVVEKINIIPDDNKANPATSGVAMPAVEVEKVEYAPPAPEPTFPDPGVEPTPPPPRTEPTKPPVVEEPPKDAPPAVAHPGKEPTAPKLPDAVRAIAEDVRAGRLTERNGMTPRALTFRQTVPCEVSIHNLMTVTFFDYDGTTVLDSQTLDYGSQILYAGKPMGYFQTPQKEYTFLGWIEADGTPADLTKITKSLTLYAKYEIVDRQYRVTWELENRAPYTAYYTYGEMPEYPFPLTKPETERYTYSFAGWNQPIAAVTEDVTYIGSFDANLRSYTVTWMIDGVAEAQTYEYGAIPSYGEEAPRKATDSYQYSFTGWLTSDNHPISAVRGDMTYFAQFQATPIATAKDGTVYTVLHEEESITVLATSPSLLIGNVAKLALQEEKALQIRWERITLVLNESALTQLSASSICKRIDLRQKITEEGTEFSLGYLTSSGNATDLAIDAVLLFDTTAVGDVSALFFANQNGSWVPMDATRVQIKGAVSALMKQGYRLQAGAVEKCDVTSLQQYAAEGALVSLKLPCVYGYKVATATVTLADGTAVPVNANLSFIMPAEAVFVTLTVEKVVYTVTFLVDGVVYHTAQYGVGETVVVPEPPTRASDDTYNYTFSGWSPKVASLAIGENYDPVYEAQFSKTAIKKDLEDPTLQRGPNRLFTVNLPIALGVVALIVCTVLWFCRWSPAAKRRKEKKLLAKKAAQAAKMQAEEQATTPSEPPTEE